MLIDVKDLTKSYGRIKALQGVDIQIEPGKIIGLLGPNSSGKTSLMKIIAGLMQPEQGEIHYPDKAARGTEAKKTIAFMPDSLVFPEWMKVKDTFRYYQDTYPDYLKEREEKMIQLLDLQQMWDRKLKGLSKGMQERVALGVTLSRQTKVYLLDEPLGGIDPVGKAKVIDAILAMQLDDSSIVISTHLVKDVEKIFDSVYFLAGGKIVFQGGCDEIREKSGMTVEQKYLEVFANGYTV